MMPHPTHPTRPAAPLLLPLTAAALAVVLVNTAALTVRAQALPDVVRTAQHDFRIETVVPELVHPFAIAFTPDGDMLVTERPGRLRVVRRGALVKEPVAGLPDVLYLGHGATAQDGREQAGMRDVVLHPNFASNRLVYLSFTKPGANGYGTLAVVRARFEGDRLTNVQEIFHATQPGNGTNRSSMWGGRLAFDTQGYLFITLGDRQWPATGDLSKHPAQDLSTHTGTTVRLHDDGRVPTDNPFVGKAGVLPEIFSYGHRNAQGMAVHPVTGAVWQNEHGPQGGDELNVILPGRNYGWPLVGFGVNYTTGKVIHEGTIKDGVESPRHVWVPSIGVSGMLFYTGDQFPNWKGDMLVGGMSGQRLVRLRLDGQKVASDEVLFRGLGRIRDIQQGPDGYIYVAVDGDARGFDGKPTPILRLVPVERRPISGR